MPVRARTALLPVVALAATIQLVPYGRSGDPAVVADAPWPSVRSRELAVAACYDCHSNQTRGRWYENVAPVSWWINNHVQEGRGALNFSEYDPTDHRSGRDVAEVIQEGSMPPSYYTWFGLHNDAKLSAAQRQALRDGLEATYGTGAGRRSERGG